MFNKNIIFILLVTVLSFVFSTAYCGKISRENLSKLERNLRYYFDVISINHKEYEGLWYKEVNRSVIPMLTEKEWKKLKKIKVWNLQTFIDLREYDSTFKYKILDINNEAYSQASRESDLSKKIKECLRGDDPVEKLLDLAKYYLSKNFDFINHEIKYSQRMDGCVIAGEIFLGINIFRFLIKEKVWLMISSFDYSLLIINEAIENLKHLIRCDIYLVRKFIIDLLVDDLLSLDRKRSIEIMHSFKEYVLKSESDSIKYLNSDLIKRVKECLKKN